MLWLLTIADVTSSYQVYYNVDQGTAGMGGIPREPYPPLEVDVTVYGIAPLNETQGERACILPGCFPWTSGAFPELQCTDGHVTSITNGGVPQAANLSLHLNLIREQLPRWIPNSSWSGNAVIDFEAWTTVWAEMDNHVNGPCYQNYSRALVQQEEPSWDAAKVDAAAKERWNAAAITFFVETLRTCVSIRPAARWGFYGLPSRGPDYGAGANRPPYSDYAAQQLPIFKMATALYPSIYLTENEPRGRSAQMIRNVLDEVQSLAARVEAATGRRPQVLPYVWEFYQKTETMLNDADLNTTLGLPKILKADGVVVWGSLHMVSNATQAAYWRHMQEKTGPLVQAIVTAGGKL